MNNELITNAFKGLLERLEKTEKFVLAQAPDICREMVVKANISTIFSIVFCLLLLVGAKLLFSAGMAYEDDDGEKLITIGTGCMIAGLSSIGLFCSIQSLIERIFCPKLFLISEFKRLLAPPKEDDEE